jgi:anaerobic magnesium-protoporphyrin IX monomethyl ester cyclase
MRVTLIHCDYDIPELLKDLAMPGLPLGVGYVAAVAEREGHKVTVIDAYGEGLNRERSVDRILESQPDVLGLSCVTASVYYGMDVARMVRDRVPKIVFGGIHATFSPGTFIDSADVVFRGESEESFPEYLAGKPLGDIGGISYKDKDTGKTRHNPLRPLISDLDSLPWPARHLFKLTSPRYRLFRHLPFASMLGGRGCPMRCVYCQNAEVYDTYRGRSPKNIVDEMQFLNKEYGVRHLAFVDEDGLISPRHMREMCDEIIARDLKIQWGCDSRVDRLTDLDLLKHMNKAGCNFFFHGVESANNETLARMRKGGNQSAEQTRSAFALAQKAGIRSVASTILGFPGEDKPSAEHTVEFLKEIKASYAFFGVPTPFPGSQFGMQCEANGWIKVRDWSKYTVMNPIIEWPGGPTLMEQTEMIDAAYSAFYRRPRYWLSRLLFEIPRLDWYTIKGFIRWSWESFWNTFRWDHTAEQKKRILDDASRSAEGRAAAQAITWSK